MMTLFKRFLSSSLATWIALTFLSMQGELYAKDGRPPNVIVILCDNLGYGDVGCFGSKLHRTPHLDRMAAEGMKFTDLYAASGVCTPSRAALLTGCYPARVNMHKSETGGAVLQPVSSKGLAASEITIAELLKPKGYATTIIGKWHLGDQLPFLPTRQGFDSYYGIPYSDDMTPRPGKPWPDLPLMRDEEVIEAPVDLNAATRLYTQEAIRFITENRDRPFFVYLPQAMPGSTRAPYASEAFQGKSKNGPWGDSVEELDWSTGQILKTLDLLELDEQTLVIWTSDNGAPRRNPVQGSNEPLKGWGYTTAEGGMRVPTIVWWPGTVPGGTHCAEVASLMDLYPTIARLAGAELPPDRVIDGKDILPLLQGESGAKSPHQAFYYYMFDQLQAVRSGQWKLYLPLRNPKGGWQQQKEAFAQPRLFNLKEDLQEASNVAEENPEVVQRMMRLAAKIQEDLGDDENPGPGRRHAGHFPQPTARNLPQ
ncbi:sulfatase family protein [Bremerella alba]|uniref:Arylsulfatase n=1 Tax=Bremerella alba TaxID=980252 RepID=A0A7V8V473_9BACT|nr:sulfatase [Bremerella alba]MBA2114640.1 Arylsulfatase [Bremerella alba]